MQNIVFALGVKAIFLALGAVGVATMWEAVFVKHGCGNNRNIKCNEGNEYKKYISLHDSINPLIYFLKDKIKGYLYLNL